MNKLRLGILAQPHRTGIGVQTYELCRHLNPAKVLLTDLTEVHAKNSRNAKKVSKVDWFDGFFHRRSDGIPTTEDLDWLLEGMDVVFVVETPLNWDIFKMAWDYGVRTVLQPNFEFVEYFIRPHLPKPDLFLVPSKWNVDQLERFEVPINYLPVPIATDRIKRREITQAKQFIHITGHKAHLDRNGTEIVRESVRFVDSEVARIKIHDQSRNELDNYWDLYNEGDVLLLPRRYGGLSLQLQEAAAAGMPIVVTEHDPYAREDCTVTVPGPYQHVGVKLRGNVDCYSASPRSLGAVITDLANKDITDLSEKSYQWALSRSWENMRPKYMEVLEELCA